MKKHYKIVVDKNQVVGTGWNSTRKLSFFQKFAGACICSATYLSESPDRFFNIACANWFDSEDIDETIDEELQPLDSDTEDSADNNVVYIIGGIFCTLQLSLASLVVC